jgi:hypothetical protein
MVLFLAWNRKFNTIIPKLFRPLRMRELIRAMVKMLNVLSSDLSFLRIENRYCDVIPSKGQQDLRRRIGPKIHYTAGNTKVNIKISMNDILRKQTVLRGCFH